MNQHRHALRISPSSRRLSFRRSASSFGVSTVVRCRPAGIPGSTPGGAIRTVDSTSPREAAGPWIGADSTNLFRRRSTGRCQADGEHAKITGRRPALHCHCRGICLRGKSHCKQESSAGSCKSLWEQTRPSYFGFRLRICCRARNLCQHDCIGSLHSAGHQGQHPTLR